MNRVSVVTLLGIAPTMVNPACGMLSDSGGSGGVFSGCSSDRGGDREGASGGPDSTPGTNQDPNGVETSDCPGFTAPSGPHCDCHVADCESRQLDCTCELSCLHDSSCLLQVGSNGEASSNDPTLDQCTIACEPDSDLSTEIACTAECPCEYDPPPAGKLNPVTEWQWGYDPAPTEYSDYADVWSTPTVARVYDANGDGKVDVSDPPNLIFVSGNAQGTYCYDKDTSCRTGVLRMLNGRSGKEIWSLDKASSGDYGFSGMSVALGDIDGDRWIDIVAMTGDGYIAMIDAKGTVVGLSDKPVKGVGDEDFGWGGGIAIGDMDNDGAPEIACGSTLYTTAGSTITQAWQGSQGSSGPTVKAVSHFVDLDGDGQLELLAGQTAYRKDGSYIWSNGSDVGYTAVGSFDKAGDPHVVVVSSGTIELLDGSDGTTILPPFSLPGKGQGGPPTVADFDGDGYPEIGVAMANRYSVLKADLVGETFEVLWSQVSHDLSSSVTGSSVFDFQGDGRAEVVYNDECFLWVYDGQTGDVLHVGFTQSFTATEASIVADVDGDGHAEMVMISNGASAKEWACDVAPWNVEDPSVDRPAWRPPPNAPDYRGITVIGDADNTWVATRTIWNQHAYHVTNMCDPSDSACPPGSYYGQIPMHQTKNWQQPWLNNFRQNPSLLAQTPCTR